METRKVKTNLTEQDALGEFGNRLSLGESFLSKKDAILFENAERTIKIGDIAKKLESIDPMKRNGAALMVKNLWEYTQNLDETTRMINVGSFDKYAYPMVTIVYPNLVAHTMVSVQPMEGPTSLIFYMQALYNAAKAPTTAGTNMITTPNANYAAENVDGEVIATGNAGVGPYTGSFSWVPVRASTISITDGTETFTDNGLGVLTGSLGGTGTIDYTTGAFSVTFNGAVGLGTSITATYSYDMEGNPLVPEIDFNLVQAPITARPRKLAARWTLEGAYNLKKLHGVDAEVELVAASTNELKFGIDQSIINNIWTGTTTTEPVWASAPLAGVSYAEHQLEFVRRLISAGNRIFQASGRAVGEWIVAGLTVSTIIEGLPGYEGTGKLTGRGIYEAGMLNGTWRLIKNSYFTTTNYLMGYKGDHMFNTGYIFSPYLLFYTTPTYILTDFISRKGFATLSGQRMVDATFYCRGSVS